MNMPTALIRRPRLGPVLLLTALACTLATPAYAQWKWKDASGKVQYSDRPPPQGTPEKDILQRPPGQQMQIVQWQNGKVVNTSEAASAAAAAAASAASAPGKAERDAAAKQKAQEQDQAAKRKADEQRVAEQMRSNCSAARSNEQVLLSGTRMVQSNGQGENVVMDDARRAAELQRVRAVIASDCK